MPEADPRLEPLSLELGPDRILVAHPPRPGPAPGLILLHDIQGVDARILDLARRHADEGYLVLVPAVRAELELAHLADLFWLRGIEASDIVGELLDWEFWFFQEHTALVDRGVPPEKIPSLALDGALEDVAHVLEALRAHEACTGQVAVVGYGLGGTVAVWAAARLPVDAVVAYDPAGLDRARPELLRRAAPLLVHAGGADELEAVSEVERFKAAFADRAGVTVHLYAGEPCDFALGGPDTDDAAVLLAWSRTVAHLRRAIGPVFDLEAAWVSHARALLVGRSVDATLATMSRDPQVECVPLARRVHGRDELRAFLEHELSPALPPDLELRLVSRTVAPDRVVEETVVAFEEPASGRRVELPVVAVATFAGDRVSRVRVYWDQASLLAPLGRLDAHALPR